MRKARNERMVSEAELSRLHPLNQQLLDIANNPFGTLPDGYATFIATVDADKLDEAPAGEPQSLVWYEPAVKFDSYKALLDCLDEAMAVFPALIPRLTPTRDRVATCLHEPGPARLFYQGCTVAGALMSRAADDPGGEQRMISSLLKFWDIKSIEVFRVNIKPVETNAFEYRGQRELQLVEHGLISARFPHSLNSAPSGFCHDYRVDMYSPSPLPTVATEPVPAPMIAAIRRHMTGMRDAYAAQPESSTRMSATSLEDQITFAGGSARIRRTSSTTATRRTSTLSVNSTTPEKQPSLLTCVPRSRSFARVSVSGTAPSTASEPSLPPTAAPTSASTRSVLPRSPARRTPPATSPSARRLSEVMTTLSVSSSLSSSSRSRSTWTLVATRTLTIPAVPTA